MTDQLRNASTPAARRPMCKIFIGSIVTELTTQESRRVDTFVTHWQAALPPAGFMAGLDFIPYLLYNSGRFREMEYIFYEKSNPNSDSGHAGPVYSG